MMGGGNGLGREAEGDVMKIKTRFFLSLFSSCYLCDQDWVYLRMKELGRRGGDIRFIGKTFLRYCVCVGRYVHKDWGAGKMVRERKEGRKPAWEIIARRYVGIETSIMLSCSAGGGNAP